MKTVVITGLGVVSPLGADAPTTWSKLLVGTPGVSLLEDEWAADLPARIAAVSTVDPASLLNRVEARRMDRSTQFAVVAGLEAWRNAGFGEAGEDNLDPERLAVSIGTGVGGLQTLTAQWDTLTQRGFRRVSPFTIPMLMANAPAANVGLKVGARAAVHAPVSACASGNEAISHALDMLRLNRADVAVAGGTEAVIHPLPLAAFAQMQALSRRNDEPGRASRPWDVDRDGFVMGEGAAVLVLETLEHAQARGARIYGTVLGSGISADSHDLVQPDPSGHGQRMAMTRCMADAGVTPRDIVHVNAHATSTPAGDLTEAQAIRETMGDDADHIVVTGTKSQTGHLLGAAGALESFATVMALKDRTVPPTINLDNPEPSLPIDVATTARELPAGRLVALNNSFGFGGHNVAIAFSNENVNF